MRGEVAKGGEAREGRGEGRGRKGKGRRGERKGDAEKKNIYQGKIKQPTNCIL